MMMTSRLFTALPLLFFMAIPALAADGPKAGTASTWPQLEVSAAPGPRHFTTLHKGKFNGKIIRYEASVAEAILKDATGKPATSVFTFSFIARHAGDPAKRPVVFIFNGGPGSASSVLMMGALGPKRMEKFDGPALANPETPLVDNPFAILDVADLVFIDPPETGFGRPLPGADPTMFRGIDADSFAVAQMIENWLKENGRINAPKYLIGESYGSLRAAALARDLAASKSRTTLNGIVLVSQAIDYNGPTGGAIRHASDPIAPVVRLPDIATFAWYHGAIDNKRQSLAEVVAAARSFAQTEYANALISGNRLPQEGRRSIAARLQSFTGIPADTWLQHDLVIKDYRRELLRAAGRNLGQFDGRETEAAAGSVADKDRDWDAVVAGIDANMARYASNDLKVSGVDRYRTVVPDPYKFEESWSYLKPPHDGLDVVLAEQLKKQPNLRLMVTQGIFDSTSSTGNTEYIFSQMGVSQDRITIAHYPGGHMLYSDWEGMKLFNRDIRRFVMGQAVARGAIPPVSPAR